ncbi:MAG: hypothetical protein RR701_19345, partial [Comamonas sp.]
ARASIARALAGSRVCRPWRWLVRVAHSLTVHPPDAAQMLECSARFCSFYESCLCALGVRELPKILKMYGVARSRLALATWRPCMDGWCRSAAACDLDVAVFPLKK